MDWIKLNCIHIRLFHVTGRALFSGKWIGVFHTLGDETLNSEFFAQFARQAEGKALSINTRVKYYPSN